MCLVSLWGPDGKYHSVFNGAIGRVPVDKTAPPKNQASSGESYMDGS